jgi:hypothetical protein
MTACERDVLSIGLLLIRLVTALGVERLGQTEHGEDEGAQLDIAWDVEAGAPPEGIGHKASDQGSKLGHGPLAMISMGEGRMKLHT